MQSKDTLQAQVSRKIQECLKEFGFDPEVQLSAHEGVVSARKQIDDKCIRVVMHISDRDAKTSAVGAAKAEIAGMRRLQVAIRPTLANRSAHRVAPDTNAQSECD